MTDWLAGFDSKRQVMPDSLAASRAAIPRCPTPARFASLARPCLYELNAPLLEMHEAAATGPASKRQVAAVINEVLNMG